MLLKNKFIFISIIMAMIICFLILFTLNNFLINSANFDDNIFKESSYEKMLDEDAVLEIVKKIIIEEKGLIYYKEHYPYQINYIEDAGVWDVVGPMNIFREDGMIAFGGTVFITIDDNTGDILSFLCSA